MEPGENLYMGGGILRRGDRVGLSCCSNGLLEADKGSLELLKERLALIGLRRWKVLSCTEALPHSAEPGHRERMR